MLDQILINTPPHNLHGEYTMWPSETLRIVQQIGTKCNVATGIECSDPLVRGVRRNQLTEAADFYTQYEQRLDRIKALGITWLRLGVPYSQTHVTPDTFDFSFLDKVIKACDDRKITLIADLVHFGLPDWMPGKTDFSDDAFAHHLAHYAETFARRYPTVKYYTPVNEPFATAMFCIGLWNERPLVEPELVRTIATIAKGSIYAREAIEKVWKEENREGNPIFVQNESFEKMYAPQDKQFRVHIFDAQKFSALDLTLGHRDTAVNEYLVKQGLSQHEYEWFMSHGSKRNTILGIDHYPWCVKTVQDDHSVKNNTFENEWEIYDVILEYWQRYEMPLFHTEVNAPREFQQITHTATVQAINRLRQEGIPVLAYTWFGDEYQVGWNCCLCGESAYDECNVGLFYKGSPQPAAELLRKQVANGFAPLRIPKQKVVA